MRTDIRNPRLRNVLACSVFILALLAFYSSQGADRSRSPISAPQTVRDAVSESRPGPQPPCGEGTVPSYPSLDDPANVKSWSINDLGRDWTPPACTGWTTSGFATLATTVARFRYSAGADGLLRHIGAISELVGVRYWSTTHKRWQTLIVDAHALNDSQSSQRRADFAPDEMKPGAFLYFDQADNLSGKAMYRMHIVEASPDRIVVDVENVSPLRYFYLTVIPAGETQSIYFLDRESDGVWRFYGIVRIGKNANRMVAGNEASSINRAVAFYRHLVGIRTDLDPPAAR
jgi:hypothetical protein